MIETLQNMKLALTHLAPVIVVALIIFGSAYAAFRKEN